MNKNNQMVQQNNQDIVQLSAQKQVSSESFLIQALDKTFDAADKELDRMEKEKPGTRRKLAGITAITIGVSALLGGVSSGIYLLST